MDIAAKSKGSSGSKRSGQQGGDGADQEEESEEEEDSDSSSSTMTGSPNEDALEEFRQQWKEEVSSKIASGKTQERPKETRVRLEQKRLEGENSHFFEARRLFLEGVELEQNGEHFQAIQKYKRAVLLVPDIEFKTFDYNRRRHKPQAESRTNTVDDPNGNNSITVDASSTDEYDDDLVLRFSGLALKGRKFCEKESDTSATHISDLPTELLIYILKWVVSKDLDVRSLERCSQVCRGLFLAARSSDLWRLISLNTWGMNGLPLDPPCWRSYFLSRPRVLLQGCYIASMTYIREGERGFQDSESYKSWHMVKYYRFLRFFSGGRVTMLTCAEDPMEATKLLGGRFGSTLQGAMNGHCRMTGSSNSVVCVMKKPCFAEQPSKYKRGRGKIVNVDVPDQEFHLELELKGKRFNQLHWLRYHVISIYKSGLQQRSEIDVSSLNSFPPMRFSRVQSYTMQAELPLH